MNTLCPNNGAGLDLRQEPAAHHPHGICRTFVLIFFTNFAVLKPWNLLECDMQKNIFLAWIKQWMPE
jgi:hypothetical protein